MTIKRIAALAVGVLVIYLAIQIGLYYQNKHDCSKMDYIASKGLCGINVEKLK
jgi:hypothetical protein